MQVSNRYLSDEIITIAGGVATMVFFVGLYYSQKKRDAVNSVENPQPENILEDVMPTNNSKYSLGKVSPFLAYGQEQSPVSINVGAQTFKMGNIIIKRKRDKKLFPFFGYAVANSSADLVADIALKELENNQNYTRAMNAEGDNANGAIHGGNPSNQGLVDNMGMSHSLYQRLFGG